MAWLGGHLTWSSPTLFMVCYYSAVGTFTQARDAAQQEEEDEHADSNLRKVTIESMKKDVARSTKMDFISIRNDSYLA
jgi:hypothetical protein